MVTENQRRLFDNVGELPVTNEIIEYFKKNQASFTNRAKPLKKFLDRCQKPEYQALFIFNDYNLSENMRKSWETLRLFLMEDILRNEKNKMLLDFCSALKYCKYYTGGKKQKSLLSYLHDKELVVWKSINTLNQESLQKLLIISTMFYRCMRYREEIDNLSLYLKSKKNEKPKRKNLGKN